MASAYQCELVIDLRKVLCLVLLQHHKVVEVSTAPASAVLAVHHVRLLAVALARHKQQVKHFHLNMNRIRIYCSAWAGNVLLSSPQETLK